MSNVISAHLSGWELNGKLNQYLITKDEKLVQEWHQLLKKQLKDKYVEDDENGNDGVENGFKMAAVATVSTPENGNVGNGTVGNGNVGNGTVANSDVDNLDNDNVAEATTNRDK